MCFGGRATARPYEASDTFTRTTALIFSLFTSAFSLIFTIHFYFFPFYCVLIPSFSFFYFSFLVFIRKFAAFLE